MKNLKIQIILFYYDRPVLVSRMALRTVFESNYNNWELSIVDDSNKQNADEVLEKFYLDNPEFSSKKVNVKIFKTHDTLEEKKKRGDAIIGKLANEAMLSSNADICMMLCDDDGVTKNYFSSLNEFYSKDLSVQYSYSKVIAYNPVEGDEVEFDEGQWGDGNNGLSYETFEPSPDNYLNRRSETVPSGHNTLDSSQVSWRRAEGIEQSIFFRYPKTANLDADVYSLMANKWGSCKFNGAVGQYKAFWKGQLGNIQWDGQDARYVPTDI